jgi:hypothetical protein
MVIRELDEKYKIVTLATIKDAETLRYVKKVGRPMKHGLEARLTFAQFAARPGVTDKRSAWAIANARAMRREVGGKIESNADPAFTPLPVDSRIERGVLNEPFRIVQISCG